MEQKLINTFIRIARENLKKFKHLVPIVFLEERDGQITMVAMEGDFNSQQVKEKYANKMRNLLETGNFKSFLFISEAWTIKRKNLSEDDAHKIRPSEQPDRIETIIITYKEDMGEGFMQSSPFSREGEEIKFLQSERFKTNDNNTLAGRFWDVWR